MSQVSCACRSDDLALAKQAVRRAVYLRKLRDESHFGVSVRVCAACGQFFLVMFGERVDWVDGDDPQTWIAVEVSADEAKRLVALLGSFSEASLAQVLPGDRRMIYHDMPKGAPEIMERRIGGLLIPGHD